VGEILPEDYVRKLIDSGVKVLLPTQFKAIKSGNFIQGNDNTLVALPTSTGKTLLGELCLVAAFKKRPGIICYLAPYIALGRQVAESFERHLPSNIRVHKMIGGFQAAGDLEPETYFETVVATPERFDALLRTHPEWTPYVRCVVCDEAHLVQNDIRGIRLEGLITRLRLLQNSGRNLRLILLSAVLAQYEKLRVWLGALPNNVVVDSWQPTARRLAFWEQNARLTWYVGADLIRRTDAVSTTPIGRTILPWPNFDFYSTAHLGQVRQQQPKAYANVAYLAEYLKERYGGPILCVCSTKEGTRRMAAALAGRFEELNTLSKTIENIIKTINNEYQFLKPMARMLRHGVAFHNSTVPHRVRQSLEDAMKGKELAAIASTTTLAEGVDLPFRFTIIVDWLTWQASGERPMPSLLFRNIAGRCGRAGVFTEGDTIVFDNPLGDSKYTNPYNRRSHQQNIFLTEKPDELTSAFEELRTSGPSERRDTLRAALASQFMAAIPENPKADDLAGLFASHTFASQRYGTSHQMRDALDNIRKTLLDESQGALAMAASPIKLTEFGEVANKTGFSPDSCRQILRVLKSQHPMHDPVTQMRVLLEALGALPEQTNAELKKMLSGKTTRFSVKRDDLSKMLALWLSGERHDEMFQSLPFVRRSSRKPTIEEWLSGSLFESSWDTEFDKFVEFTTGIFEGFLPWLLRACGWLSDFAGDRWSETDWASLAKSLERNPAAEQPT
jgi:ATP-dependent DNA helicase